MIKVIKIKALKRFSAVMLALALSVAASASAAFAEESEGEANYRFITEVGNFVKNNAKYEDITDEQMAKAALKTIIIENPKLYETALKGMMSAVDEYTTYYTPSESEEFVRDLSGGFAGIGISMVNVGGNAIVQYVYENSPAERAGIEGGDILVEINGENVEGRPVDEIVGIISGDVSAPVEVKVRRYGREDTITFYMRCEEIEENPVYYTTYEQNGTKVGYVALYTFSLNAGAYMKEAVDYFDSLGIKNVILDLRGNGGGYLDSAIDVANIFLKDGDVIALEEFRGETHKKVYIARDNKEVKYNTAVLIDENSASASEFVTAAIQENKRGVVIGAKSFGKATVQNMIPLSNGGLLKYTEAVYKTPDGNDINKAGIIPDIAVKNDFEDIDVSQSYGDFTFSKIYTLGDRGQDIVVAKRYLDRLGFFYGDTENDEFDMNLYLAVSLFQRATGLFEYGELDLTTQTTLYDRMEQSQDVVDKQLEAALEHFGIKNIEE